MDTPDLSSFFTTKSQANDFYARISDISAKTYETDFNLEKNLQDQFGIKKADKFLSLLRENEVPAGSIEKLNDFFEKIKKTITSLPEATLTLAIDPDNELLEEISNWFLLNLKHQVLLEVQVNPKIIAGAVVNYEGKYLDGSIKPVFDKVYTKIVSTQTQTNNVPDSYRDPNKKSGS